MIAQPEPENSILEIVQAYTAAPRSFPLVMLGTYKPEQSAYHAKVLAAAKGASVFFPGAIYDAEVITSLRFYATAYIHGHQVGGTTPSLVEALAAGNPVVAHRNPYNQWVAGSEARSFANASELDAQFSQIEAHPETLEAMQAASRARHGLCFPRELILSGQPR